MRRDFGIWAGILSILHVAIGQNVHLRGRPWLYYVYAPTEHHAFPVRHDLFGLANYTGALSTLVLIALLATSNDLALKSLGSSRWKQLQRWNYTAFGLVVIHSVAYLTIEKQKVQWVITVAVCIAIALAFQIAGFGKRRSMGSGNSSS